MPNETKCRFAKLDDAYRHSFLYKICQKFKSFARKEVCESVFLSFFIDENRLKIAKKGIIYSFFENIIKKMNECVKAASKKLQRDKCASSFENFAYVVFNSFVAINFRFLGILIISFASIYTILSSFLNKNFSPILALCSILLGFFMFLTNINFGPLLKDSKILAFIEKMLDVKLNYKNFDAKTTNGFTSLVFASIIGVIFGTISSCISIKIGIFLLIGMILIACMLHSPKFSVFLLLFVVPILKTRYIILLSLISIISYFYNWENSEDVARPKILNNAILCFLAVMLISAIFSFKKISALETWAIYAIFAAFSMIIVNLNFSKKNLLNLLKTFTISALFVACYGLFQYLLGLNAVEGWIDTQMFGEIGTRAYSTFQNPNVLGEFLVLILPICMSIVIVEKENISKIFYFLIASILFATLLLTFSRGSWVGILLSFAFATFLLNKQIFIILCVFFACAMPFFPKNVISRFLSIGNVLDSSTSYRVQIWLGTLRLIKKFWLFGIGAGEKNFSAVYPQFSYSAAVAEHSHNLFLQMFVESGAIGFSVFCLILLFFYRGLIISVKKMPKRSPEFVINLGLGSSIIGFLIQGLFDNCFYNYRIISIFWITLELGALSSHIIWENDCNKISGGDED